MNTSFRYNEFHDIDHFMESVTHCMEVRSIQIQPGKLLIKVYLLEIDGLFINYYQSNKNLLEFFSIHPTQLQFVLTSPINRECKWCGINVPTNAIAVLHPHREYQDLMPTNWGPISISLENDLVLQESLLSEFIYKQTLKPETAIFELESSRIALFRAELLSYFNNPQKIKTLLANEPAMLSFRQWVIDELRLIFIEVEDRQRPDNFLVRRPSKRYQLYSRAQDVIEDCLTEQLTLKQLCDRISATPRTLQLCFKELSGISPVKYILARKLHAVQQDIISLKSPSKTISHMAQNYGFYHAGRFSSHYQRMFGELPSLTLKRRGVFVDNLQSAPQ